MKQEKTTKYKYKTFCKETTLYSFDIARSFTESKGNYWYIQKSILKILF